MKKIKFESAVVMVIMLMAIGFSNQLFAAQNVPHNLGRDVQPTVPVKAVSLSAQPKINILYAMTYFVTQPNPLRPPRPKTSNVTFTSFVVLNNSLPARGSVVMQYYDTRTRLGRVVMSPDPENDLIFKSEYELKNYPLNPRTKFHCLVTVYDRKGKPLAVYDSPAALLTS